jgi:hypothetical protein
LILRKCGVDKNLTYLLNMLTFDAWPSFFEIPKSSKFV